MKVVSFCIFGNEKKYRQGLLENLNIISTYLTDYHIFIVAGNDVDQEYLQKLNHPFVTVIQKDYTGHELTLERFFIIDNKDVDIVFSRDSDSRITQRELWCIKQFENDKKFIHIIRDHKNHDQYIMAGMCGFNKINGRFPLCMIEMYKKFKQSFQKLEDLNKYGIDQLFLQNIYKTNLSKLVHSSNVVYGTEKTLRIPIERSDKYDFIGNAIDFDDNNHAFYLYEI